MPRLSFAIFRFIAVVLMTGFSVSAAANDASDRIGVPGPISFDGIDYVLTWSSNPSPGYFKQEYVPAGETVERYRTMVLVEGAAGVNVADALNAQVYSLNQRRGSDPLLNMDVMRNEASGEAILDFIVSSKNAQGAYIVEWNAYRYAPHAQGVVLFALSHRAYGDEVRTFLGELKRFRSARIAGLARHPLPDVSLPD